MKTFFNNNKISKPPLNMDEKCCDSLTLDVLKYNEFISKMSEACEIYYISESKLKERMEKTGKCKKDILKSCIPDKGNVMAGEFGEILSTELMSNEIQSTKKGIVYNPYKLRWKEDRNKAAQKTDVVLIQKYDEEYNIFSSEVKVKSSGCSEEQLYEMFEGLRNDRATRLAVTLHWLKDKENLNGENESIEFIEKVIDRYKNFNYDGNLKKHFIGILVADEDIDSIAKFRSIKPKFTAHKSKVGACKTILESLGATIENDKIIDFSNVKLSDIKKLPEGNNKEIKRKGDILKWYESANLSFGERENLAIKIIELEKLQENYEFVFERALENGSDCDE